MTKSQFDPPIPPGKTLISHPLPLYTLSTPDHFDYKRDAYGFTLRPQHVQRYREYASIYKQEEEERLEKWSTFLEQHTDYVQPRSSAEGNNKILHAGEQKIDPSSDVTEAGDGGGKYNCEALAEGDPKKEVLTATKNIHRVQTWVQARPSFRVIESVRNLNVMDRSMINEQLSNTQYQPSSVEEMRPFGQESDMDVMLYDTNTVNDVKSSSVRDCEVITRELEFLVQGGVPRDLRGEIWQAFVGVRTRRVEKYYKELLDPESDGDWHEKNKSQVEDGSKRLTEDVVGIYGKWRKQIEKDLPRTFPGHPALDEGGRNSLRRVLIAYARHNPSVGYCQALNFFAGLLLLMMPEENAFWTFVGIFDDYFDGYYSQEMIESQVDQLVFEDLMREIFPKLVNHLDYLGVQVAWLSGPWFLSIFVNMIPWESVLRVWDVLLFEGNRVMLFRTALALMELYGPALVATDDAGDAITLLQNLVGSTFDSSQLVLTACMGYLTVTEERLQQLREKHRPAVLEAVEERSKGIRVCKDSKGLASKLYSFKHDAESLVRETNVEEGSDYKLTDGHNRSLDSHSTNMDGFLSGLSIDSELDSLPDIQEQVVWLKVELCRSLEEKRSATLRAEELETAFMEIVKEDNRRELTAKVEQLQQEVSELRQLLDDKKQQESVMLQVLMRVEQEQKAAEEARILAEKDAAAQRYAVVVIQEKYEKAMASVTHLEKRVVMAESMLEATLQYESGQVKAQSSPSSLHPDSSQELQTRKSGLLSFGLNWRDRNKAKPTNVPVSTESISAGEMSNTNS